MFSQRGSGDAISLHIGSALISSHSKTPKLFSKQGNQANLDSLLPHRVRNQGNVLYFLPYLPCSLQAGQSQL